MAGGTFPTSLPTYTITSPAESPGTTAGGTGLSPLLNQMESDIEELSAKVGIGASTPATSGYLLTSTGAGGSEWSAPPVSAVWGLITGTLSDQTDLNAALDARVLVAGDTMTGALTLSGAPTVDLHAATKKYVDDKATSSMVVNETPTGAINGSNVNYTTASTYATGSLQVYLNGQRLISGASNDYVEVSSGFTMNYAPLTGDVLLVGYNVTNSAFIQGSNSDITQETPTGAVNSSNTSYTTLQSKYVANTLEVYINGVQQTRTTDYIETTPGSGVFTMAVAPVTGDILRVSYQFSTGASGNADTLDGFNSSSFVGRVVQQVFTADGTYTPTSGMIYCIVECVGGGGGGGGSAGAASNSVCASGGGAGSYARSVLTAATIGASKAVDIGAGGTAGAAGSNPGGAGSDTTLGTTLVVGKGGSGGTAGGTGTAPGAGGVVGTGDVTVRGNDGMVGLFNGASTLFAISGGAGGASYFGGAPMQAVHVTTQTGKAGSRGAGGQGGSAYNTASTAAGGAGGDGYMVITEFCAP